jgi:hypothetical protein
MNNTTFWRLYADWQAHDYDRDFAPSIDRIDDTKGYTMDNVQWLVWRDNRMKPKVRATAAYRHSVGLPPVTRRRGYRQVLTFNGATKPLAEWCRQFAVAEGTVRKRLDVLGWTADRALMTPGRKPQPPRA